MSKLAGTGQERSLGWALFSWRGRIRRATFAWGYLAVSLGWIGLLSLLNGLYGTSTSDADVSVQLSGGPTMLVFVGLLASFVSMVMLAWKRFQDVGLPGWSALAALGASTLLAPLAPIGFLALALWPGQPGDNRFGPPPVRARKT